MLTKVKDKKKPMTAKRPIVLRTNAEIELPKIKTLFDDATI